ncbi:MAG: glycosyltransferase [Deltaproteobacteria bacterium]|nr:glycosyltransferase [Deltaproteobacteria bacterium]
MPTIVSTTLAGNCEHIIGDALRSVASWVDLCLVVDTGIDDGTLEVAREVVGDKLRVLARPWDDDFAAARNFALAAAQDLGAEWALTLDTDERIERGAVDVGLALANSDVGVLMAETAERSYAKERFIRLPTAARWVGPTHEALQLATEKRGRLRGVVFWELPKSGTALRHKLERDERILSRHVERHPDDTRWRFYLGETLRLSGQHRDAIEQYEACASRPGWDEQRAWACYRKAYCHARLDEYELALDACAVGLARHAGIAELPWLASLCAYKLGRHAQARYWAQLSITWGWYQGEGAQVPRIGFRDLSGLYEGPFEVLRCALRKLGDTMGATLAEAHYHRARHQRLRHRTAP